MDEEIIDSKVTIMVEAGDEDLYRKIAQSKYFKGSKSELNLVTIFCLAVAIGFNEHRYIPLDKPKYITRKEYLLKNNQAKSFVYSVAISHEKNLKILADEGKTFEIVQGYANGGIKLLYAQVFDNQSPDFDKVIESKLRALNQKK